MSFNLALHASDADGDPISWRVSSPASHGVAFVSETGTVQSLLYAPEDHYHGADQFEVQVSDPYNGVDTIHVNVTVSPRNDPPANTMAPTISGAGRVGQHLSVDKGAWHDILDLTPGILSYLYQWRRADDDAGTNATDIASATNALYVVQAADNARYLQVIVSAYDDGEGLPFSCTTTVASVWCSIEDTLPSISTVDPSIGSDNTLVTISGTHFMPGANVYFGGVTVPHEDIDLVSETTIRVLVPSHASGGLLDVTVTNPDAQSASLSDAFMYMPTVAFDTEMRSVSEAVGTMTLSAYADAAIGFPITIPFVINGSALGSGIDHTLANGSIAIPSGQTNGMVFFDIVSDVLDEWDETIIISMTDPILNAYAGTITTQTLTIVDDDAPPTLHLATAQPTVSENAGSVAITATLSAPSSHDIEVPYEASAPESAPGSPPAMPMRMPAPMSAPSSPAGSYTGTILIRAGETQGIAWVEIVDDPLDGEDQLLQITMGIVDGATPDGTSVDLTIVDDDPRPVVELTTASQQLLENEGVASFEVTLSAMSSLDVSVPYTVNGTAGGNGVDHTLASGLLMIPANQIAQSVSFNVMDDVLYEGDEQIVVSLGTPVNADAGTILSQTISILDNDPMPLVRWTTSDQELVEDAGSVTIYAGLDSISGLNVDVPYTVSGSSTGGGSDHNAVQGSLTIPAGQTNAFLTLNLIEDALNESAETLIVTMGTPTHATRAGSPQHVATILDNDPQPTVGFLVSTQTVEEAGGSLEIALQLNAASGLDMTVPYAVSGSALRGVDHTVENGRVTIPAGQTLATIPGVVLDDALDEPDETLHLSLGIPVNAGIGAFSNQTITILDNDEWPSVRWGTATQQVSESVGVVSVSVELDRVAEVDALVPYTVSGSAIGMGIDHEAVSDTLRIEAGQTNAVLSFAIVNDAQQEEAETIELIMGIPVHATPGAVTVHAIHLIDNDYIITTEHSEGGRILPSPNFSPIRFFDRQDAKNKKNVL